MDNKDLQKLLDSLDEGPLGKPEAYWDRRRSLEIATESRTNSKSWKASRGKQYSSNSQKVIVHKGTKVGNARWGTLKLIDTQYYNTYNSINEAARETGVTVTAVSACVNGKMKFCKGFTFEKA